MTPASVPPASPARSGLPLLVVSAVLFGVMALFAKAATARGLPGAEVALVRFGVTIVAVSGCFAVRRRRPALHNGRALFLRGLFGGSAVLGFFLAIAHLPVGLATLLNYTQPIPTALFAALFLGERLHRATALALVLTMIGVVLVVEARAPIGQLAFGRWELVALLSSLLSGAAVTAIRWGRRTDGPWEVLGAFGGIGFVVCLPLAATGWVRPDALGWVYLVATGAISVAAQLLYTQALGVVQAATAGVVSQLTPVSAFLLGVMLLDDRLSGAGLVGALVTFVGVAVGAVANARRKTPPAVDVPRSAAA